MSSGTVTSRMNYNEYAANITGSPKALYKPNSAGVIQQSNPFLQRQTQAPQQNGVMPVYGGGAEKCARCSKSVYLAEKKVAAGRAFHTRCFSCQTCNRKLDATNLSEHKGEIYCKTCYTRQFGVHGLVSGVTMSTENPVRETRHSRRSSYGSDLDAPVITHQQSRPRAHSNDNMLRGETSAIHTDELPKMFPWRNDVIPAPRSPSPTSASTGKSELELLIEKNRQEKANNPIGFGRVIETAVKDDHQQLDRRQSSYTGEQDRQKLISEGETIPYGHAASAFTNVPIVSPPKAPQQRPESHIGRIEMPTFPAQTMNRSPSPTPSSPKVPQQQYQRPDSYVGRIEMPTFPAQTMNRSPSPTPSSPKVPSSPIRRQSSRDQQNDISDNFSRLTLNEQQHDQLARKSSKDHITSTIASENPLAKHTFSYVSSYETSQFSRTEQRQHSRDSSPTTTAAAATTQNHRTSSSTSGYASSNILSEGNSRHSASPSPNYVPPHDYLNTDRSPSRNSQVVDRRPSSPRSNERTPSALQDFVTKTNPVTGTFSPTAGGKYSTLAALVHPMRPVSQQNYSEDDEDFN